MHHEECYIYTGHPVGAMFSFCIQQYLTTNKAADVSVSLLLMQVIFANTYRTN